MIHPSDAVQLIVTMSAPVPTFILDRDAIVYRLLSKVSQVYDFVTGEEESVLVMQETTTLRRSSRVKGDTSPGPIRSHPNALSAASINISTWTMMVLT